VTSVLSFTSLVQVSQGTASFRLESHTDLDERVDPFTSRVFKCEGGNGFKDLTAVQRWLVSPQQPSTLENGVTVICCLLNSN